jgi:hypothetical protein
MKRKKGNPPLWSVTGISDDRYSHMRVRVTELAGSPFLYLGRQIDPCHPNPTPPATCQVQYPPSARCAATRRATGGGVAGRSVRHAPRIVSKTSHL